MTTTARRKVRVRFDDESSWGEHVEGNVYRSLNPTLSNVTLKLPEGHEHADKNGQPCNMRWGHLFEGVEETPGRVTPICIIGEDLTPVAKDEGTAAAPEPEPKKDAAVSRAAIRHALLAMAYQEVKPGAWFKPIGYHTFHFDEAKGRWTNWFKAMTGELGVYESFDVQDATQWSHHSFEKKDENVLALLKSVEAWTRVNVAAGSGSAFELNAIDL